MESSNSVQPILAPVKSNGERIPTSKAEKCWTQLKEIIEMHYPVQAKRACLVGENLQKTWYSRLANQEILLLRDGIFWHAAVRSFDVGSGQSCLAA